MRVRPARFPSPGGPSHPPACANLQHPDLTVWRPPPARAWAGGGLARPVPDGGIQSRSQRALVPPRRTRMRLARRTRWQCAVTPLIPCLPARPSRLDTGKCRLGAAARWRISGNSREDGHNPHMRRGPLVLPQAGQVMLNPSAPVHDDGSTPVEPSSRRQRGPARHLAPNPDGRDRHLDAIMAQASSSASQGECGG